MTLHEMPSGSWYGSRQGKAAVIRQAGDGTWQVKMCDPSDRNAGHDGWVLVGVGYENVAVATTDTGVT